MHRYHKQQLFSPIGEAGQRAIGAARVLVCGCGALGSVIADQLVRAGVGLVRIVDRDFVDLSNLQRQMLFDEDDVARQMPKAITAAEKLRRVNSEITIEGIVADVSSQTIHELAVGIDLIVDGTDNYETRFLLNDWCLDAGIPWVHGGCIGSSGQVMAIVPGKTACYRCVLSEEPPPGTALTCDTAGVIAPAVHVIASLEVSLALQILTSQYDAATSSLWYIDVWRGEFRRLDLSSLKAQRDCAACDQGKRDWLLGQRGARTAILCGRNAVQITPATRAKLSLEKFRDDWAALGSVISNPYLVKLTLTDGVSVTLFSDARAVITGTEDVSLARSLYSRYVGD